MSERPASTEDRRKTGPLELPPGELPTISAPPTRRRLLLAGAVVLAALALLGVVTLVLLPGQSAGQQRPVETVQAFAAAVEAKDPSKMLSYVEPTVIRREIGAELRAYLEHIDSIRFTDARYELVDNDGSVAHVRWTAKVEYSLRESGSGQYALDNLIELANVEGSWYLRNVNLPRQ